jgi:hypothetical protein
VDISKIETNLYSSYGGALLRLPSPDLATGCANAGVPSCLQDPAANLVVSFPDDYPNSVRHFLMVGFMGFLIGAGIFFYFGYSISVAFDCSFVLPPRTNRVCAGLLLHVSAQRA